MVFVISLYFYGVIVEQVPYTYKLLPTVLCLILCAGSLAKLVSAQGRRPIEFYEKIYSDELGNAFINQPFKRQKLLCACRLYDESNYKKSLKYLLELLKEVRQDRDSIPVLLFIALCYTDIEASEEAIKVYYKLLEIDPNNAQAHSNIGALFIDIGDYEMALKHYNRSIEINPNNYFAYVNRANYYFRIEEYENAIIDAKKALELKNNGVEASSLLTIVYAIIGEDEEMKHYYHIAITSGKNPEDLNEAIEYYLSEVNILSDTEDEIGDKP